MRVDYNRLISPPAPFIQIQVAHPDHPLQLQTIAAKIDSGADVTAVPLSIVQRLNLPIMDVLEISGYDDRVSAIQTYFAIIELAKVRGRIQVIAISEEYALLGRDVLNHLRVLLDGPALALEILE
ncbi:MAG: hypothetical protein AABZ78_08010 [Chloroflexota bacterium]